MRAHTHCSAGAVGPARKTLGWAMFAPRDPAFLARRRVDTGLSGAYMPSLYGMGLGRADCRGQPRLERAHGDPC